jgi:predicted negative regulator of RcsB-dependent stress response
MESIDGNSVSLNLVKDHSISRLEWIILIVLLIVGFLLSWDISTAYQGKATAQQTQQNGYKTRFLICANLDENEFKMAPLARPICDDAIEHVRN